MPSGIHSGLRGYYPRDVCSCGKCKNCKHRAWKKRTGRVVGEREAYGEQFEKKVDAEPSFDVLTERLIEKFRMRGWD